MAVAGDPGHAQGIDLDAVGARSRGLHGHQPDLPGGRVQAADHVAVLQGEPEPAVLIEDRRMGVPGRRVGHGMDGDLLRFHIELADGAVLVAGVPDIAGGIEGDAVGHGAGRQGELFHLAGRRVEAADQVAPLAGPPEGAVGRLNGIAGPLAEGRDLPLLEAEGDGTGDQGRGPPVVGRKMRRQIAADAVAILRAGGEIDHGGDQFAPAGLVITGAAGNPVVAVTAETEAFDPVLALPRGQPGRQRRPFKGERDEKAQAGGRRPKGPRSGRVPFSRRLEHEAPLPHCCDPIWRFAKANPSRALRIGPSSLP